MAVTVKSFALPSIDTQMVDPQTGEMTTAWFNFFLGLYNRTGGTQGSKGNGADFLYPSGTGTAGQVLTSQAGSATIWTDPLTEEKLTADGFIKQSDVTGIPSVSIAIGPEQGAISINKLIEFWGVFNIPVNLTGGDPQTNSPSVQTVTVPFTVKRLLDVSVTPYLDPNVNIPYVLGGPNFDMPVFNYGYDRVTGLYVGRSDGATNKFDVFSQLPGIHRYRGKAELN